MNIDFLRTLLATQSPSSAEQEMTEAVREYAKNFCETETDVMGNLYLHHGNPEGRRVMVTAHCDEVGFQIVHIDDNGLAYIRKVGGIDRQTLPGTPVAVMGRNGKVQGVFGKKSPHLQTEKDKGATPEFEDMWIDMGFTSRQETLEHVAIGDFATAVAPTQQLNGGKTYHRQSARQQNRGICYGGDRASTVRPALARQSDGRMYYTRGNRQSWGRCGSKPH